VLTKLRKFEDSRTASAIFWAAAVFALVMALLPHPPKFPGNPSDKIQHVVAFATLGLLGSLAYSRAPALRLIVGLSVFGAFIEVAQAIPVLHRDSDPLDWVADTVACVLAVAVVRWWRARSK
jgi:VanZ family protein